MGVTENINNSEAIGAEDGCPLSTVTSREIGEARESANEAMPLIVPLADIRISEDGGSPETNLNVAGLLEGFLTKSTGFHEQQNVPHGRSSNGVGTGRIRTRAGITEKLNVFEEAKFPCSSIAEMVTEAGWARVAKSSACDGVRLTMPVLLLI